MAEFFTDEQNLAELVSHMPEEDRQRFGNYGHFRIESAFLNRVFVVYKPTGLTPAGRHRPPEILNLVKVVDFGVDIRNGCYAVLKDQNTEQELTLGHVPRKLYSYPLYMSVPARVSLRWDARRVNDRIWRSLSFALLVKAKNKADFYSKGNVYAETPSRIRQLYPDVTGQFTF